MFEQIDMSRKPLTEQVSEKISNMIIEKHLTVGEKLPNEFELAEYLNVGRGTVREAVKLLVSRNVVTIHRGKGTFVKKHPGVVDDPLGFAFMDDKYRLASDLLEIRVIVEPQVARLAAERATEEDISAIDSLCDEVEQLILSKTPHLEKDVEFHTRIAQCTKNQVMPNLIPLINYSIGLFGELTQCSLDVETIHTHRALVKAIAAHDPQAAADAMREHLQMNQERMDMLNMAAR